MSQHDYNLINQSGSNFRADLNNALTAIVSNNSGASEPATMFAYELWVDTSNSVMKIRNSGNDAWITLPWSITADNTVDINGGTINGISSLSFSSGSTVASILDEDNLSSDSATALATQQSIKAYVDSQVTAQDLDFQADSGGVLSIDLDSETFTLNGGTGISTAGAENTVTFSIDSTVATLTGSQTLTNKTIDLDSNTLSNIETDNLKSGVLDTDLTSVSGSDNTLASAKAIKTYVDAAITAEDLDISDGSNSGSIDLDSETLGLLGGTGVTSALSGNNITFSIGQSVGTSDNVQFGTVTANLTGQVSDISNHTTSDLSEGTNKYYTDARSFTAFDTRLATKDTDDLTEGNSLYYTEARWDARLAQKTTDNITEGFSNLFFTNERADDRISALIQNGTGLSWVYDDAAGTLTGTVSLSSFNTSQLSESGNLYYTDARARASISENSAQLSYDSSTGVLTYTQGNSDTVSEGSTNLFYTDARVATKIDSYVNKAFVDALNVVAASTSGNAATATALATTRTFSITGDATASAQNFDGSGNVTLSLTIDDDAVALGTKTTGNYVATIAGTTNEIEVTGSGSETAAVTIGLPNNVSIANDLTVAGDLTVNGDLTYLDTTNLKIEDNLFELNSNLTGSPVNDSGMLINRGSSDNAVFIWDESADKFTLGLTTADGSATGNITLASLGTLVANLEGAITGNVTGQVSTLSNHDTDNLSEGSSNLYFTNARARSAISASGDISYDSSTGVISFTATAAPVTSVNTQTGAVVLDTGDISESGNLYYTDARARAAISEGSTQLSYNSGTGVLTFTQGNSDTVAEGSSNLYYTDTRVATKIDSYVDKAFVDNLSVVAASATGNAGSATILQTARTIAGVSFDGSANISLDTSNITEDGSYLYYTDARANSAIDARVNKSFVDALNVVAASATGNAGSATVLANARTIAGVSFDGSANITLDTADITEDASALYFTNARARSAVSASGDLAYNSSTGVFSFTERTDAEVQALITGGTGVTVSSGQVSIGQAVATSDSPTFANMTLSGTDSIKISSGTTAQRNGTPVAGMFRYNTTTGEFEGYTNEWGAIGGGGGSFTTDIFAGDGSDTTFTVTSSVGNENDLMVFIDGVFQAQDSYSVSGTTLTFSTAPANGRVITVYHAKAVSIGTPSDNSVGITQLNVSDGTNGQVLTTNGSGTLSFSTVSGTTINNNADNRIITGSGTANTLNGEANLTFDSSLVITKSEGAANSLNDQISLEHTSGTTGYHIKTIRSASTDNPDGIAFVENTTERMRIRGGNVGIGNASPQVNFVVGDGTNGTSLEVTPNESSGFVNMNSYDRGSSAWRTMNIGGDVVTLNTGGTERLRIDNAGNLNIGTTGQLGGGWDAALNVSNNNNIAFFKSTGGGGSAGVGIQVGTYTATTAAVVFYNGSGGVAGSISLANGNASTSVSYNTSSDYRLKENVVTDWDATTRLKQLKPSRFNFIADADTTVDGFLAHEVEGIVPEAITGTKDATETFTNVVINNVGNVIAKDIEEDDWIAGKEDETYPSDSTWEASHTANVYQGIDQAKLVPLLTKALQEQQTLIEDLQARIETLEG